MKLLGSLCCAWRPTAFGAGLLAVLLLVSCAPAELSLVPKLSTQKGNLHITVTGLRNDNGQVMVSLFAGSSGFPDDVARSQITVTPPVHNGRVEVTLPDIPYGVYAISVLHDENSDGKMATSLLGIPREGFGFSGNPQYRSGQPDFDEARFYLFAPLKDVPLTMRYETGKKERQQLNKTQKSRQSEN